MQFVPLNQDYLDKILHSNVLIYIAIYDGLVYLFGTGFLPAFLSPISVELNQAGLRVCSHGILSSVLE